MVEYRDATLDADTNPDLLFSRQMAGNADVGGLEGDRLVAVGLG